MHSAPAPAHRAAPHRSLLAPLALITLCAACAGSGGGDADVPAGPPATRKDADVVDDYHGTAIADPFRWLEDQDSEEVLGWADRQNGYTEAYLSDSGARSEIRDRLQSLWNHPRRSAPSKQGELWISTRNDGLQNQSLLYAATTPDGEGEVLLDPNDFSTDGSVSLGSISFSEDGSLLAYSTSDSGSDWREWRVMEVASRRTLDDHLKWSKFSGAAWTHDHRGFFYQRHAQPAEGEVYEERTEAPQVCYHRIGTPQEEDLVIYERPDRPSWIYTPRVTADGSMLILAASEGTDRRNRVLFADLEGPVDASLAVRPLLMDFDASYGFVGKVAGDLLFRTDLDAERGRIVALDPRAAEPEWRELVPQAAHRIEQAGIYGGQLLVTYLVDACHRIERFGVDGAALGTVKLPGIGTVRELVGRPDQQEVHLSFETFLLPPSLHRLDPADGSCDPLWAPRLDDHDPSRYVSRQVAYTSADGTRCALFLVHRKGLRFDGENPTYLYGYGGFDISMTPRFSVPNLVWCERGGVYAHAILRGGGEYGEAWHQGGMLKDKQNVFDDFTAAADYLIRNDYCRPGRLGIGGGSNGGLLVGAALTQHPELFGAAVPQVGVLDMLRYHRFTIGWAWIPEYGSSEDPEMFPVLAAYSPLHNIEAGRSYPPTLVMTGDHDDRVLPGHSYKFAATLQEAQAGGAPILLRVTRKAGHGSGKPLSARIDEAADRIAFLEMELR